MGRAQSAVEFLIIVGFALVFFVAFLLSLSLSSSDRIFERQKLTLEHVAQTVQKEVAFAHTTVDGYERSFTLPLKIVNLEYEIEVVDGLLYLHTFDFVHALAVPIQNVTGTFAPGQNALRRTNSTVYANQ